MESRTPLFRRLQSLVRYKIVIGVTGLTLTVSGSIFFYMLEIMKNLKAVASKFNLKVEEFHSMQNRTKLSLNQASGDGKTWGCREKSVGNLKSIPSTKIIPYEAVKDFFR